ncbi:MAG: hypothetical protein KGN79_15065 [Acidobacteriota bacterium]|nr:hypothetical protein [Acidobacteriota bacterium]
MAEWNEACAEDAMFAMLACCGAKRWAREMVALRALSNIAALSEAANAARS